MSKWYDNKPKRSAVREYATRREMQRDADRAAEFGWRIASVSELTQRPGCLRGCTLGLFALVFHPRPHLIATYQRDG